MKWDISLHPNGYVYILLTGTYSTDGHFQMLQDIVRQPYWKPSMKRFFDGRALGLSHVDFQGVLEAGKVSIHHREPLGASRTAFLVSKDTNYTPFLQFITVLEGEVDAVMEIFTDEDIAVRWLLQE